MYAARRANGISFRVSELALDGVWIPSLFVEKRGCHAAKPVAGHLGGGVAKAAERGEYRVVAHRAILIDLTRKDESSASGQRLELTKDLDPLVGKGD